jgi:hypothetical protein
MRPDHEWDDDTGLCMACGAKRTTFAPPPELRAVAPAPPVRAKARHDARALPRGRPAGPPAEESVARIDYSGVIAALELERDELEIAIATLRRLRDRKGAVVEVSGA